MKDKLTTIAACLIFLAGAAIFSYPLAKNWYYDYSTSHVLDNYMDEIKTLSKQTTDKIQNSTTSTNQISEAEDILPDLYQEMSLYNQTLFEDKQKDLTDPFSYESASFDLTEYGLSDNIIGYLTIPAMDVELPIYLGANEENLAKGAVHLGQTSMPIGGINTNVVLAAHRGYKGIPMFRDIQNLKTGDIITVTTLWDTLTYQVLKTEIILPDEINKILIQPGADMLTLFTCHPYRQNSHRYVVYCERILEEDKAAPEKTETVPSDSGTLQTDMEKEDSITSSRQQILMDRYVPIGGIVFLVLLFILCMIGLKKK
ncbi:MAG: class C sortase [Lachnospiraceae bacterium]|nr:class C sortase [Lachnospiraceae bacterium]